ncbi:unnamed protein product [Trichobilharzia szidati]|nr:unnamed protein product [Trichobilharzia szidati]
MKFSKAVSKLSWFRDNLPSECLSMKQDDVKKLISRNVNTKSRPVSISTDINNLYVEQEYQEYSTCGIEIPDLTSKLNVESLR